MRQQQAAQPRARRRFVVDDQHAQRGSGCVRSLRRIGGRHACAGSSNHAIAPPPARASRPTCARSPCSAVRRSRKVPRPTPVAAVVRHVAAALLDLDAQPVAAAPRAQRQRVGSLDALDAMAKRVLEQRLDRQRRHAAGPRSGVDLDAQAHAVGKTFAHDGRIAVDQPQLLVERAARPPRQVGGGAQQGGQPRQQRVGQVGFVVDRRGDRVQRVEQEVRLQLLRQLRQLRRLRAQPLLRQRRVRAHAEHDRGEQHEEEGELGALVQVHRPPGRMVVVLAQQRVDRVAQPIDRGHESRREQRQPTQLQPEPACRLRQPAVVARCVAPQPGQHQGGHQARAALPQHRLPPVAAAVARVVLHLHRQHQQPEQRPREQPAGAAARRQRVGEGAWSWPRGLHPEMPAHCAAAPKPRASRGMMRAGRNPRHADDTQAQPRHAVRARRARARARFGPGAADRLQRHLRRARRAGVRRDGEPAAARALLHALRQPAARAGGGAGGGARGRRRRHARRAAHCVGHGRHLAGAARPAEGGRPRGRADQSLHGQRQALLRAAAAFRRALHAGRPDRPRAMGARDPTRHAAGDDRDPGQPDLCAHRPGRSGSPRAGARRHQRLRQHLRQPAEPAAAGLGHRPGGAQRDQVPRRPPRPHRRRGGRHPRADRCAVADADLPGCHA